MPVTTPVTTGIYGQALMSLGSAKISMSSPSSFRIMLLSPTYNLTASKNTNTNLGDIVIGDQVQGTALSGATLTYDATNNWAVFNAANTTTSSGSYTFRYGAIYFNQGTNPLFVWLDFGSNITAASESTTINWSPQGIARFRLG